MNSPLSRRAFLKTSTVAASLGATAALAAEEPIRIQGFEKAAPDAKASLGWKPISDRKIRVGIVGYGVCRFGAEFGFQDHPNVEVIAVSDLLPDRCAALAKACRCAKTYPSLEELVKDDRIEAVFVATDAPSHARHCIEVLHHGKHVASAVPAVFGSLEEADALLSAVRSSGRKYMMFETSCYHEDLHAMRELYRAGHFGRILYSEGEYYHYMSEPIPSYQDWRVGLPPQWYPTHSNAYHLGVTGGRFSEVSCVGLPSRVAHLQAQANRYRNPFGTEIALFKTPEGGSSRMAVSWDTPGDSGERGRIRGEKGSYYGRYEGLAPNVPAPKRPPLPPAVEGGGHGGSHGHLTNEFVSAILENRTPLVDITMALHLTVAGILAHHSATKEGEWMKIPEYRL
ncbi:MAG: Gfo/Idh/MocA family oxidoreductase [Verrucomicrobiales bacterium]|nr:Gfo/Idh/MocA family oxidoreductase [Verrucomicrobiales bacterium]